MKKKLLPLAIAAAITPGFAAAADVSGFVDVMYNISSDSAPTTDSSFGAFGEVDFIASPADGVTTRIDVDVDAATDTVAIEQAYFAWGAAEGVTVMGGVMNNPIGMECGDAPCMWGTNGGVVGNILNNQTSTLDGNNVAGLAIAGAVGPATVTLGFLNDIGGVAEENSVALVVNFTAMEGLDLELGYVSQDNDTTAAGAVVDFNVSYATPVEGLSVALDYLAPSELIDSAVEFMVNYKMDAFGAGVRVESVSWAADVDDTERTTFHVSYDVASNLVAILEFADGSEADTANTLESVAGVAPESTTTLELIATF